MNEYITESVPEHFVHWFESVMYKENPAEGQGLLDQYLAEQFFPGGFHQNGQTWHGNKDYMKPVLLYEQETLVDPLLKGQHHKGSLLCIK